MNYKIIELKSLKTYVIGDIHGNMDILQKHIINHEEMVNCNLIIAGDIGLGFRDISSHIIEYRILNKLLEEKGITLYLIRGNHDDPSYFTEHKVDMEYIKTLEDYTILHIDNTNILCVGGAISIDRRYRIKSYEQRLHDMERIYGDVMTDYEILRKVHKGYWEGEMPIYDEEALNQIKEDGIDISYIITHTSPSFAFKNDAKGIDYWLMYDLELTNDLKKEREVLSNIYNKVKEDGHSLSEWIYGHFHGHNEEDIEGVKFTALNNADYEWDLKEIKFL